MSKSHYRKSSNRGEMPTKDVDVHAASYKVDCERMRHLSSVCAAGGNCGRAFEKELDSHFCCASSCSIATIAFYSKDKSLSQTKLYKKVNKIAREINKIKNVALVDLKGEQKEQWQLVPAS